MPHPYISSAKCLPLRGINRYSTTFQPRFLSSYSRDGPASQAVDKGVLRIMPLGGSVTRGVGSSDGTGYRKPLLQMLRTHGLNAQMVGSRRDGSMPNNDHEGWRGFRVDQIEAKARKSVEASSPDIFMVNAGSNDCLQGHKIAEVGERMGNMLDCLWMACPNSTILLSTLVVNADREIDAVVTRVNDQFRALAERMAIKQRKIVLVDMHTSEGPDVRGLVDGIHPDDGGYRKMAKLWLGGVQEGLRKGFIGGSKHSL